MGKWNDELKKVVVRSAENKKAIDDRLSLYGKAIEAAQAFIGAHAKSAPKLTKALSEMMEAEKDCGEAAAELSVYEEDLEKAKKEDNKAEIKKIEDKMKPLVQKFENGRKEMKSAADDAAKAIAEISKQAVAVQGAFA
jgi:hypothetical protein